MSTTFGFWSIEVLLVSPSLGGLHRNGTQIILGTHKLTSLFLSTFLRLQESLEWRVARKDGFSCEISWRVWHPSFISLMFSCRGGFFKWKAFFYMIVDGILGERWKSLIVILLGFGLGGHCGDLMVLLCELRVKLRILNHALWVMLWRNQFCTEMGGGLTTLSARLGPLFSGSW